MVWLIPFTKQGYKTIELEYLANAKSATNRTVIPEQIAQ